MKKLIKIYKLPLIIFTFLSLLFISLGVIPLPYDVTVPASVSPISEVYEFENIDNNYAKVNSVSVMSYYNVSILGYLTAKSNPYAVIEKHNDYVNTSTDYEISSGTIQKNVSLINGLIAAYELAGNPIKKVFHGDIIHSIYGPKSPFKIGDVIISCVGKTIKEDYSVNDALIDECGIIKKENNLSYINLKENTSYEFVVRRNGKDEKILAKPFLYRSGSLEIFVLGISCYQYYTIDKSNTIPSYNITSPSSIGPSAGLMQALYTYLTVSKSNIAKNLNIVGTGTIDVNGKAGAIGGVQAKVCAAHLAGADVFFVPEANYDEALCKYEKLKTKMKLVKVSSLQDIVDYLKGNKG